MTARPCAIETWCILPDGHADPCKPDPHMALHPDALAARAKVRLRGATTDAGKTAAPVLLVDRAAVTQLLAEMAFDLRSKMQDTGIGGDASTVVDEFVAAAVNRIADLPLVVR